MTRLWKLTACETVYKDVGGVPGSSMKRMLSRLPLAILTDRPETHQQQHAQLESDNGEVLLWCRDVRSVSA